MNSEELLQQNINNEMSEINYENADIFISYRRKGGVHLAWRFYEALKKRNYRPFLDFDTMRPGPFDKQLYKAIDKCKDFILILPTEALDRCTSPDDWVRLEVERAAADGKNIIPIKTEDFVYPAVLPESLEFLRKQQTLKITTELFVGPMFDSYVDSILIRYLKSTPVLPDPEPPEPVSAPKPAKAKKGWLIPLGAILLFASLFGFFYTKHLPPFQLPPTATPTPVMTYTPTSKAGESLEETAAKGEAAYQAGNYEKALLSLIPAAESGNDAAQNRLGWMYANGEGLEQSFDQAFKWYQKAADQGNAEAQTNLGYLYSHRYVTGLSEEQADEKAVEWYQKAADQENPGGQFNLGKMYEEGRGVAQSYEKALEYYQKAAAQGDTDAQFNIGKMYENGLGGLEKSEKEALSWYRKAADRGHAEAQYWVGFYYENGLSVEKDNVEALLWYRESAEQGYEEGQVFYRRLQRTVNAGLTPSPTNTATFTPTITPIPTKTSTPVPTTTAALSPTPAASATITPTPSAAEMFSLGKEAFDSGDYEKAAEYLIPAAEGNDASAQFYLGWMYGTGNGVEQSDEKSAEWYQKSADQGHPKAQVNLGIMYYNGAGGLEKNPDEAFRLFRLSAGQNNTIALKWLGFCYEHGVGTDIDLERALRWYKLAAAQGDEEGKRFWESLQGKIPPTSTPTATSTTTPTLSPTSTATPTPTPTSTLTPTPTITPTPSAAEMFSLGKEAFDSGDYEKAAEWYQKSADQGNADAQVRLGMMYYEGQGGLEKDPNKAFRQFQLAAGQNNTTGLEWMGYCFEHGYGVEKDTEKAKRWYKLAVNNGSEYAQNALEKLGQSVDTQPSDEAIIQMDVLLRTNPSSSADVMRSVLKDSTVTLLGESRNAEGKNWIRVRTQQGQEGWIPEEAVTN